jgi:hypothetical protein
MGMGKTRQRFVAGLAAALLGSALMSGVATAQAPAAPGGVPGAPAPGTDAAGSKMVNLSPQEELSQAQSYVATMDHIREGVRRDLEEARNKGDVVKKLCLDDKLNQLDIALQKATDRTKALDNAVKAGDSELSNHEFTILNVLYQRSQALDAEAKLCIGKEIVAVGESSTQMEFEGILPGEEATVNFPIPPIIVEPPTCSSCFR